MKFQFLLTDSEKRKDDDHQRFSFKNAGNAMDNISRRRNGHFFKRQELQKSVANLRFKYHGLSRLN